MDTAFRTLTRLGHIFMRKDFTTFLPQNIFCQTMTAFLKLFGMTKKDAILEKILSLLLKLGTIQLRRLS